MRLCSRQARACCSCQLVFRSLALLSHLDSSVSTCRLHRDPNQPLRSKPSPVLSQLNDDLEASHHGESSPLRQPSELFITWCTFPFCFPSVWHLSRLNNPVLLAASTFCPCSAFCLDAHPSTFAGTTSWFSQPEPSPAAPTALRVSPVPVKASVAFTPILEMIGVPVRSLCVQTAATVSILCWLHHISLTMSVARSAFTYNDLLPGKDGPESYHVADLGMG